MNKLNRWDGYSLDYLFRDLSAKWIGRIFLEDDRVTGDLQDRTVLNNVLLVQVVLLLRGVLDHRNHSVLGFDHTLEHHL